MNGYEAVAQGYKKLVEQGKLTAEQAQPEIRVLDFLGECDPDDIYRLVDSSAFNSIIKAFCQKALMGANVDQDTADSVMDELRWIMDTMTSKEVTESV